MSAERKPYHHGDLRAALLREAAAEIASVGVAGLSLRRIAARAGVSHTAAAHHFGDKRGLLTALAVEGHRLLDEVLARAGGDLLALALAYVRFAAEHPAHIEVMFGPSALHQDDASLIEARAGTAGRLEAATGDPDVFLAAWSFVHGLSALWLGGNLPAASVEDLLELTARAARTLHLAPPDRDRAG